MKTSFLVVFFLLFSIILLAQPDSALRFRMPSRTFEEAASYVSSALLPDSNEGGGANTFLRWLDWADNHRSVPPTTGYDIFWPASAEVNAFISDPGFYCLSSSPLEPHWKCIGPYSNYYNASGNEHCGRIESTWGDPYNLAHIRAASNTGGLWETRDTGHLWRCITDNAFTGIGSSQIPGTAGITSMAIDPLDTNNIFLQIGIPDFVGNSYGYDMGIMYSDDGGQSWHLDTDFSSILGAGPTTGYDKGFLKYMPGTHKLFAFNGGSLFVKTGIGSGAWTDITPYSLPTGFKFTAMDFSVSTPGKIVLTSTNISAGTGLLWICDTSDYTSWTTLSLTMPSPYSGSYSVAGINGISISPDDTAFLLVKTNSDGAPRWLMKTSIVTAGLSYLYQLATNQKFTNVMVSRANRNIVYVIYNDGGQYYFYKSIDGGATLSSIHGSRHPDARCVYMYNATTSTGGIDDIIIGGTDGGVVLKRAGSTSYSSISGDSLCITQLYSLANTDADDEIIEAGAQDNGGYTYVKNRTPTWKKETSMDGDNFLSKFARNGSRIVYGSGNFPGLTTVTFTPTSASISSQTSPDDVAVPGPENIYNPANNIARPYYFDENNTAYVGYRKVWKKALSSGASGAWGLAFNSPQPLPDSVGPQVGDEVIADNSNLDTVYVAFKGIGDAAHTASYSWNTKLFMSSNATASVPNWTNITDTVRIKYSRMKDIEVAPHNSARIWVCYGDMAWSTTAISPSSVHGRVSYSPNCGYTWYDVSHGLPNFPVNKILYQDGSNDILYAATDIGVYRCDFSTFNSAAGYPYGITWQCFNSGMPACMVTDMEFNYCSGKLRIATYGRGIWETSIMNIWGIIEDVQEINTSTVWTNDKDVHGAVRVKAGNTLAIQNCKILMARNAALIVEKGATLIVDNATLTNNCEGCMWYGIEAIGDPLSTQLPLSNQGRIVIRNGSVIENARYAVSNCDYWNDPVGTAGAIIQARNSFFINNHNSITMMPYHAPGTPTPANISYFDDCTFLVNDQYRGNDFGYRMKNQVDLNNVEGVRFAGCKFINRDYRLGGIGQGVGINSLNSGFKVTTYCATTGLFAGGCPDIRRSYFCGLEDGVVVKDVMSIQPAVSIDQADFDSVSVGVLISGHNNVATTRCNFIVGRGNNFDSTITGLSTCGNIGIAIQNAFFFKMEGNSFKGKVNPSSFSYWTWMNFGTVIANTGMFQNNMVYRNTFDSLTQGVRSVGNNRGTYMGLTFAAPMGGLQIVCNAFSNNNTDIAITPYGSGLQGIGFQTGLPGMPAKNTFSGSTYNIINNCPSVTYHYDSAYTSTERPSAVSAGVFTVGTNNASVSCSSTFPTYGSGDAGSFPTSTDGAVLLGLKTGYVGHQYIFDSLKIVHAGLMDLGSGASYLMNYIDTSTNSGRLYDQLVSASPYLSDTVMMYLLSSSLLSYDQMDSIVEKNPEALRHDTVYKYTTYFFAAAQADNPLLPDYVSSITNTANGLVTQRGVLEGGISYEKQSMDNNLNQILFALRSPIDTNVSVTDTTDAGTCTDTTNVYYSLDSNSYYYGFDSLNTWLQKIGGVDSKYERIGYYNGIHSYLTANGILNTIVRGSLTAGEQETYDTYKDLWNMVYSAESNGRSIFQLSEAEIAEIDTFSMPIITANKGLVLKWNITRVITDHSNEGSMTGSYTTTPPDPATDFPCVVALLEDSKPGRHGEYGALARSRRVISGGEFSVHPNPSSGLVTFEYNLPKTILRAEEGVMIVVMNILGEKVMEQNVTGSYGKLIWDPKNLASGMYFYQASTAGSTFSKGKLVLLK